MGLGAPGFSRSEPIVVTPLNAGHPPLPTNELPSKARLEGLIKKLERKPEVMAQYHGIIEEQMKQGIVEQAPEQPTGERKFYLPHKPVIKESAELILTWGNT